MLQTALPKNANRKTRPKHDMDARWLIPSAFLFAGCYAADESGDSFTTERIEGESGEDGQSTGKGKKKRPTLPSVMVEGEPMFTVLGKDGIPALDDPTFVTAAEASAFMKPEETVLGVVGRDGTAKCYSAWQLDDHEIVNDQLDGEPIAATW